jgi:hypothetical protein
MFMPEITYTTTRSSTKSNNLTFTGLIFLGFLLFFGFVSNVAAEEITKLNFTSSPQEVDMGKASTLITVQTQNENSISTQVSETTTIILSTNSFTGEFSDTGCVSFNASTSRELTMSSSTANRNFCYRDTTPGTYIITVTPKNKSWTPAEQTITINSAPMVIIENGGIYTSIQAAINAAAPNDTIIVYPGTYNETIDVTKDGITIRSLSGPEATIISGGGGVNQLAATIRFSANNTTLDGFTIKNKGASRAIGAKSSSGTTIKNNIITESQRGVSGDWYGKPSNLTIINNLFTGVDRGIVNTEGITTLVITGNTFSNITANAVAIGVGATDLTIENNEFKNVAGRHYANYSTGITTDILTVLGSNTFDEAYAVDTVTGSILQAIYASLPLALFEAAEGAVIVSYPTNKVLLPNTTVFGTTTANVLIPQGSTINNTESLEFLESTLLQLENNSITIPTGVVITRADGQSFDASQLDISGVLIESLSGKKEDLVGAIKFGLSDSELHFSAPITIEINVGLEYEDQVFEVFRSTSGINQWTQDGIVAPRTCTITNGKCIFSAIKASYYGAFTPVVQKISGSGYTPRSKEPREMVPQVLGISVTNTQPTKGEILNEMTEILNQILILINTDTLSLADGFNLVSQINYLFREISLL